VVILEARDRLGGRIFTDYDTFKDQDGITIPVDLGAAWIHGEEKNPLAEKARQFHMSLIATSEQVKMLDGPMAVVGHELDIKTEKLFNQLLDDAVSG
jgi:monoamine oxidase